MKYFKLEYKIGENLTLNEDIELEEVTLENRKKYVELKQEIFNYKELNLGFLDHILDKIQGTKIVFFMKYKGEIIGIVGTNFKKDHAFLYDFGLLKQYRGQAISKKCLNNLLCYVKEKGYTETKIRVRPTNFACLQLCVEMGFK